MEVVLEIQETDEQIKKRKKGMGSKNHSGVQESLIVQMAFKYYGVFRTIPELSLDINGKERIPDLSIYKNFEVIPDEDEIRMKDLPLGVVEILSPKQPLLDLVVKSNEYFDAGIVSYWLVLPEVRSIYVFHVKNEYEVFSYRDVLKDEKLGIELDLSKVF